MNATAIDRNLKYSAQVDCPFLKEMEQSLCQLFFSVWNCLHSTCGREAHKARFSFFEFWDIREVPPEWVILVVMALLQDAALIDSGEVDPV